MEKRMRNGGRNRQFQWMATCRPEAVAQGEGLVNHRVHYIYFPDLQVLHMLFRGGRRLGGVLRCIAHRPCEATEVGGSLPVGYNPF
jgi:hypothetical protein